MEVINHDRAVITAAILALKPGARVDRNRAHMYGERATPLKTTFKALRKVILYPWTTGEILAAALVLLHFEHDRITWLPSVMSRYMERLTR